MTGPEFQQLLSAAELAGDAPTIDLHGLSAGSSVHELDAFLHRSYVRGERVVEIIHGRGSGTLMAAVRETLGEHPLVDYFSPASDPSRIGGSTFAVLTERKKPVTT